MTLKRLELNGFKSFGKKTEFIFTSPVTGIVGPNGSGKSNVVEAIRFVLGEQSMKSLRGKGGTDLIFKGGKGTVAPSRASVTVVFDNHNRKFQFASGAETALSVDFDEVAITREVYADGSSAYKINGTDVRLKDIVELLSSVHIGASGHHIISQGEADHILTARAKDRREMIEDALGLKVYQYRIRESERKLEKSRENMREAQSLRREIAPHITFLKKQVEKIERGKTLREEVKEMYGRYLPSVHAYLIQEQATIGEQKKSLLDAKRLHEKSVAEHEQKMSHGGSVESAEQKERIELIAKRRKITEERDSLLRILGRLEGALELVKKPVHTAYHEHAPISYEKVSNLCDVILEDADRAFTESTKEEILERLTAIRHAVAQFKSSIAESAHEEKTHDDIARIEQELATAQATYSDLQQQEARITKDIETLEEKIKYETTNAREEERAYYEARQALERTLSELRALTLVEERHTRDNEAFDLELREGGVLIGPEIGQLARNAPEILSAEQRTELKRTLERAKIKLEEIGGGSGVDTIKEYQEAQERDAFLIKELADVTDAIKNLEELIMDLREKLEAEFKSGIHKINTQFKDFFKVMFGGGDAFLEVTMMHKRKPKMNDDEEDLSSGALAELDEAEEGFERGVEVHVSLPQKKVRDLAMLSGGERSLTSIALLFAISQVNPPPFLVLDETDAALDEANSRKYGSMIERLSHISELVVVTHNRETMSRAGVLYGVTIGGDSVSKVLSIKLDEAGQYAK